MQRSYEFLNDAIPVGKENAIHQTELAEKLGVTAEHAKRLIHDARREGMQILSSSKGYWFARDNEERRQFVSMMRKQAISRHESAKRIAQVLEQIDGQISVESVLEDMNTIFT